MNWEQPAARDRLMAIFTRIGLGWLYAGGMLCLILNLNHLPTEPLNHAIIMFSVLVLMAALTWNRYALMATGSLLTLLALILWMTAGAWVPEEGLVVLLNPILKWFAWAVDYLLGLTGEVPGSFDLSRLSRVIAILVSVLTYLFVVRFNGFMLAFLAAGSAFLLAENSPLTVRYLSFFLMGVVLLSLLAARQKSPMRLRRPEKSMRKTRLLTQIIPLSCLIVLLALLISYLAPATLFHSRTFEGWLDDQTTRAGGWFRRQSDYVPFSIKQAGFYPLSERLGGPVILSDTPVLRVFGTDEPLLLRGSVRQIYDGRQWHSDPEARTYRYDSSMWKHEQTEIFEMDLPLIHTIGLSANQINQTVNVTWSPIGLPTKTLFMAGKPLAVNLSGSDPFQAYFRPDGQLFSKHWIKPGQHIQVTGRLLKTDAPLFASWVRQIRSSLEAQEVEVPEQIRSRYLQIPDLPEYQAGGEVAEQVEHLLDWVPDNPLIDILPLDPERDPYRVALHIRQFLMNTATYALDVPVPPDDVDFVAWFLETREGYCVYFATALTMLCRLAGIPARYVEGYYAPPPETEGVERILTARQAHAWTEVYIAGIGWITMDATPGIAHVDPLLPSPPITPSEPSEPSLEPTDVPTPVLTITPSETSDDAGSSGDDKTKKPLNMISIITWLFAIFVILISMMAVYIKRAIKHRKHRHDPLTIRSVFSVPKAAAFFYWSEISRLLGYLGQTRRQGQSPAQFVEGQVSGSIGLEESGTLLEKAAGVLNRVFYSSSQPSEDDLKTLAELYDTLEILVRERSGLFRWLFIVVRDHHSKTISRVTKSTHI